MEKSIMEKLGIYPLENTVIFPEMKTSGSACADIHANFTNYGFIEAYTSYGKAATIDISFSDSGHYFEIPPGYRVKIPTNLIFDIPPNHKILVYPRSGLSYRSGLTLVNSPGVIDSDYVDPVYVLMINLANEGTPQKIFQGDRIAQIELVPTIPIDYDVRQERPMQKTERNGGFGSTGK